MSMTIVKGLLDFAGQKTHSLSFFPSLDVEIRPVLAIFGHGFTSHKASLLNWTTRLAEEGAAGMIFDWPGHYLGNFSEVEDFEIFKTQAYKLFGQAFELLCQQFKEQFPTHQDYVDKSQLQLILGGHSLGGLLSLKAMQMPLFDGYKKQSICVGLGMPPQGVVHIFDTPFYKSTLNMREQLVSPALCPQNVFPWIKEEKSKLQIRNQKIYLITGADDVVVGKDGTERFASLLHKLGNKVAVEKPIRLPHHTPELAAPHIKKYLKDQRIL